MKIFPLFLLFYSFFLCTSTNINECKKLWGMNNEINGVTVSNIGIYMCIDDPLNIYSSINKPSNQLILSDEQLNIQNFNESVQRKINNTINITNITQDTIDIVFPTTTTPSPTSTTPYPTTTTPSPTTTTKSSTTTTPSPTTTTKSSTTTTPSPTTITLTPTTTNLRINMSKSALNKNKESKIDDTKIDLPLIITITCVSILACILCIRCNPLVYEFIKRRCTKKISIAEKKELPQHTVKLNIKEKKQKKVTPLKGYARRGPPPSKIPPQVITPKRKVSLGFNTMGNDQDWYKKTFQDELSQFKDMDPPPSAPKPPTPKLPIPTLKADLIDRHVHANKLINNKMDNIINNIENTKKEMSLDKKYQKHRMNIREVGKVQQRVNSIERKKRNPDFRDVRLNSWTNEGKKPSRDFN
jgi:hypothetical protein